jgi:hypothetical protein
MNCRHCARPLPGAFLDLGFAPPSNAYLDAGGLRKPETHFPLRLSVCEHCWLVQTEDYAGADELFDAEYAYFSSTSSGWLAHAAHYSDMIVARLGLGRAHHVVEIASNDGYLLRNFVAAGIPCLGVEPTASTAAAAEAAGIPVLREFFGTQLAHRMVQRGQAADLIVGNNVYAHVPDINDFTRGLKLLLKPAGTITLEFPHLLRLLQGDQFDTVYHEHFSYFSLRAVMRIFAAADLRVFDVEELPTHGGSLRVYGCHAEDARVSAPAVARLADVETAAGLEHADTYRDFQLRAQKIKDDLVHFLIEQKRQGVRVAGYGAAAKGNTLLNYAGVRPDLLAFVCDAAPSKQGRYMPGSHIPIRAPDALRQERPDVILVLPWNILDEIMEQLHDARGWGARFAVAVPHLRIL